MVDEAKPFAGEAGRVVDKTVLFIASWTCRYKQTGVKSSWWFVGRASLNLPELMLHYVKSRSHYPEFFKQTIFLAFVLSLI